MHLTKKNYAAIGVILIIVIIAVIVIVKFLSPDSAKRQNIRPIIVIGNMTKGAIEQSDSFTGDILPTQQANIYPKVGGNIEKNFADIGQSVIA